MILKKNFGIDQVHSNKMGAQIDGSPKSMSRLKKRKKSDDQERGLQKIQVQINGSFDFKKCFREKIQFSVLYVIQHISWKK